MADSFIADNSDSFVPEPIKSNVGSDRLRELDKPLEPVGLNQLLFLPPANEMRQSLTSAFPDGKIRKAVDVASNLIPMNAEEAALMAAGGEAAGYVGGKVLKALPEVAAKRLAPEAEMLLQRAKGSIQDLVDYPAQAFPGYFPRPVKLPPSIVPSNAAVKAAGNIAALGATTSIEEAAGTQIADKVLTGKAGNINLDYIDGSNVRNVIKTAEPLIKEQVKAQSRTGYTDELMKSLADSADVSVKDLKESIPGDIMNAEYMLSARNLLHESANKTWEAAKAYTSASDPTAKAQALGAFKDSVLKHQDIQLGVSGLTAEAGRLLRQFRIPVSGSDAAKQSILKAAVEEGSYLDDAATEALAKKIGAFTEGDITKFVSKAWKATATDKLIELTTALKLTNPVTYLRNIAGNTLAMLTRLGEKSTAPFIDYLRTGGGSFKPRSVYFGELPSEVYGMVQGVKRGAASAADELLKVFTGEQTSSPLVKEVTNSATAGRQAIGGTLGKVVRIPYNILSATDEFFWNMLNEGAVHSSAYRKAVNEGLGGMDLAKRVTQLAENPTPDIAKAAGKVSDEFTFHTELGRYAKGLNLMRQHPVAKIIMPFFKTPVNIAKFVAQRTPPFSLLSPRNYEDVVIRGGPEASEAIARMAMGATMASAFTIHALEGCITGSPPTDKAERDALERTGWRSFSVKLGKTYHSYLGMDPIATQLATAADIAAAYSKRGQETPEDVAFKVTSSIVKNLANQPYLQGVSGLLDALSDPDKSGAKFVSGTLAGFVPTGVAALARATDRIVRSPSGVGETLKARIPGLSEEVVPRRNVFGEPYVREEGAANPISSAKMKNDPINQWMVDQSYVLGYPSKTLHGRKMDPKNYDQILARSGNEIKIRFEALRNSPGFMSLPYAERIQKLNTQVNIARTKAEAPFIVPTELKSLGIDIPLDDVQNEVVKRVILSPTYKLSKNDVSKKDLILNILGRTSQLKR